MLDKIWDAHAIATREDGQALLAIDRHYVHEGSFHAFGMLDHAARRPRRPDLTFAVADHYAPSSPRPGPVLDPELAGMMAQLRGNAARHGVGLFDLDDPRQGIVHVAMPEQGLTLPGLTVVCGDSHTSTHGAFGALAFGIGTSEVEHVLATQCLPQSRPRTMEIRVNGNLGLGVTAKDIILAIIGKIGTDGATGYAVEYTGEAIRALSMEGLMTVCNMSIEAGARAGMIAPDEKTFAYIHGKPSAPAGEQWEEAVAAWRALPTDVGASYDTLIELDAAEIAPHVSWGTSPGMVVPITSRVPSPEDYADPADRRATERALEYMGLDAGIPMRGIELDTVFIGSCTNGRIEDLRAAASILKGHTIHAGLRALVVPGSAQVKLQAEAEGLDQVFKDAGFDWREAGCSMCLGMNPDILQPGERCASTSNRNFEGRQGKGGRTHLVSPQMAAAAAIEGHLVDIREWEKN